ncbi:MAG TPA: four-carbon acid sugar kinase family protein [Candidatus Limiplasma sp.]|nr:four-carbon acid sugar kinase family protein [Candidatus Limiplasma sp.]
MRENQVSKHALLLSVPAYDLQAVGQAYRQALAGMNRKIVVLDDDPTGVQTVHDVYVYTDWTYESIREGFTSPEPIFFILTNSRGFSREETVRVHREIARNIARAARTTGKEFMVISRSDSTLRGHYPAETETLRETLEAETDIRFDGEIVTPFFPEGGRLTANDVHYVAYGDQLMPCGQTEYADDKTFGYKSSNLREWIAEKYDGRVGADSVASVSLAMLRSMDIRAITGLLKGVTGFGKVVVNALTYEDMQVFVAALIASVNSGKSFLFRSAAALTKVMGGVEDRDLLTRDELVNTKNQNGGLILVGSHVKRTTEQLNKLKDAPFIRFIEFDQHLALDDEKLQAEQARVVNLANEYISAGQTVAVYTRRDRMDLGTGDKSAELHLSKKISAAVTGIVYRLSVRPNFIIAKGGITSSDVGTQGLQVRKALVMGQILKGVPVWLTGPESRFPGMPYVIFPGNVGDENALLEAVLKIHPGLK